MSGTGLPEVLDQLAGTRMSRTALIGFLTELARRMGTQMALCCGREVDDLPGAGRGDRQGRLA